MHLQNAQAATAATAHPCVDLCGSPARNDFTRRTSGDLARIEEIIRTHHQAAFHVVGDCLAAVGVEDGDLVAVDFEHYPAPPVPARPCSPYRADLCLCYAAFSERLGPYVTVKEYGGKFGPFHMVHTRYAAGDRRHAVNFSAFAQRIFGVVFAVWDRGGVLKWERDPAEFPEVLEEVPTIHGTNFGAVTTLRGLEA